jgi:hypothetical protein
MMPRVLCPKGHRDGQEGPGQMSKSFLLLVFKKEEFFFFENKKQKTFATWL